MNYINPTDNYHFYGHRKKPDYHLSDRSESQYGRTKGYANRNYEFVEVGHEHDLPRKYLKTEKNNDFHNHRFLAEPFSESSKQGLQYPALRTHNKENLIMNSGKKLRTADNAVELSMEEGEVLLNHWEENHFIDFNSWLQNAKAKVSCDDFSCESRWKSESRSTEVVAGAHISPRHTSATWSSSSTIKESSR